MSMIGNLRKLSEKDLRELLERPERISEYLFDDDSAFGPHADIDIDKAWHGLHFLLGGNSLTETGPLGFLVNGGTSIGEEDVGYGPARGFTSSEVKRISAALNRVDRSVLTKRYDPQGMARAEIYPDIWNRPEEASQQLEYLVEYFEMTREFISGAAGADEALLVYLT